MNKLVVMARQALVSVPLAGMLMFSGCASVGSFPSSLNAVEKAPLSSRGLEIQKWQTSAGSRVLFVASDALPMVDMRIVFDAGSARDGDIPGLASMTMAMLDEGAGQLSVTGIAEGFEALGAKYGASSYRDMALVELRSLSDPEYLDPALGLVTTLLSSPTFPQDSLERLRQQSLIGLQQEKQVPGPQASKAFMSVLFGEHPYAHPSRGTEESLAVMKREDLQRFYRQYLAGTNAVIALTGDLTRSEAEALAEQVSQALPKGEQAPALPRATTLAERQVRHIDFDSSQTILLLGNQAIWRGHPDWVPLYVGNEILGGSGFASILTSVVREEKGYVYGIGSGFSPMAAAGPFTVQLQTANDNADEALSLTLKLISDFVTDGPSEEQVRDAVDNITGSFPLGVAENDDIVGQLGAIGFYDLPLDYLQWFQQQVRQVTAEQIHAAFLRNLDPQRLAIVSVGPVAPSLSPEHASDMDAVAIKQAGH